MSGSSRSSSSVDGATREAVARRADEDHLVGEERLEADAAMAARRADDPELELARRDALDDRVRVGHGEEDANVRVLALELAEQHRDDDRRRARRRAEHEIAGERRPSLDAADVRHELLLEREQLLRAAVEPPARLGRLDATAGAIEELRPEPLLERAHLQRDGRLRDAEPLGRLREAPALDDGAECGELARVHKRTLIQCDVVRVTPCASGSTSRTRRRCRSSGR